MPWVALHPQAADFLGYAADFLFDDDPRPAREQFDERYQSGWFPMAFEPGMTIDQQSGIFRFPGDPAYVPVAFFQLRDEMIYCYQHEMFAIVQKDGTFEVGRMT